MELEFLFLEEVTVGIFKALEDEDEHLGLLVGVKNSKSESIVEWKEVNGPLIGSGVGDPKL